MKQLTVTYKDYGYSMRGETYTTGPYYAPRAKEVAANLSMLGCYDLKFEEVKDFS